MSGYTRQDITDAIADGNTIESDPLDAEFDALQSAFSAVGGHSHDGTFGEGAPITTIGPTQDVIASANSLTPKTNNALDLGSPTYKWRHAYVDGITYTDALTLNGTAVTSTASELNVLDGILASTSELNSLVGLTASASELNTLDGITASTAELNILDGVTATASEINILDGVVASTAEINYLSGVTGNLNTLISGKQDQHPALTSLAGLVTVADRMPYTTGSNTYAVTPITAAGRALLDDANAAAQLVTLGVTSTAAELNKLDGATASTTELNYVTGVTSSIQTQLNTLSSTKQGLDATLTALAALNTTGGLVTQTGTDTFTKRSLAGTANQIAVSNADGVAGNPTVSAVVASQAEAEAGTDTTKLMTSQRVAQAIAAQSPAGLGVGQTWQDVLASRTFNTSYQNTTGKPIQVAARGGSAIANFEVSANGSTWVAICQIGGSPFHFSHTIVPDGHYYRVNGAVSLTSWAELR